MAGGKVGFQGEEFGYRQILWRELERRRNKNAGYSLRSFARDLNMSASQLSEVLRQKQGLSFKKAHELAQRLPLSQREKEAFPYLVQMQDGRTLAQKSTARHRWLQLKRGPEFQLLKEDIFCWIADWYHLALMELITIDGFQSDVAWMSKSLGIKRSQVEQALLRLQRLNLIGLDEKGKWTLVVKNNTTTDDIPSAAIQKFHLQISQQFQNAITQQSVEEREVETFVMAINKSQLPELKQRLRRMTDELVAFINQMEKKDTVYALSMQLFRLLSR
jgi:uncharacterized protein (TIGR02147 family)